MTLSQRKERFNEYMETHFKSHKNTCSPNACWCPERIFIAAVEYAREVEK